MSRRHAFDNAAFFDALDAVRCYRRISWKQLAAEAGVSASTLTRMSQGKRPDVDSLFALIDWSGLTASKFLSAVGAPKVSPDAARWKP